MTAAGSRAERPLVILGPTASGKSTVAMDIARIVDGVELVSIDSMQVYRGMDIGTATPTLAEQQLVPHHLINIVDADSDFTVGEFQRLAREVLTDIVGRGGVPILVGGTGLYLRAVIDDLEIPARFPNIRAELEADPDTDSLYSRLLDLDPVAASRIESNNRRRTIRALEVCLGSGRPFSSFGPGMEAYPKNRFVQVALHRPRDEVNERIANRYRKQIADGFLDEVKALSSTGFSSTASHALGYRELLAHIQGDCTLDEALESAVNRTCRFARRQERWFRRDPRVNWVKAPADGNDVTTIWDEVRRSPA